VIDEFSIWESGDDAFKMQGVTNRDLFNSSARLIKELLELSETLLVSSGADAD
jgi:hypothetical protein